MLRVVFMGTPDFAVPALDAIHAAEELKAKIAGVYTQPDRPVGRGLELRSSPVKKRALELGLPVFQPEKLSAPGEFEQLAALKPDVIVVVAFGQILKKNVIELPRLGCVNIHSSLLPRWRGAAPMQWAILSGDGQSGVTTMRIAEKLDAGDILLQERTPLASDETAGSLHDRLSQLGAGLIVRTLAGLRDGVLRSIPQDESKVTYAAKLTKEMEWLNPREATAAELDRRIRALNPWPGTSVWVEGMGRLKIKQIGAVRELGPRAGRIFEQAGMLLLGATDGAVELQRVQWEGKAPLSASEFLNGLRGRGKALPLEISSKPQ